MDDRAIAIAHLALADVTVAGEIASFRDHWDRHLDEMASADHSGDCKKQPWTCSRCMADEAYNMVPVYRELFGLTK